MQKNTASQKWTIFAFGGPGHANEGQPITGDAANITANLRLDGGAADTVDDVNPTELEDGYYFFNTTQAETNADLLHISPESSTPNVVVIGVPGAIYTTPTSFNSSALSTALALSLLNYLGPYGYGIYINSNVGNTNVVVGEDGTFGNPVSTLIAARTLASAIGARVYYVKGNSSFTVAAPHDDWDWYGFGHKTHNLINLGNQDHDHSRFYNMTLEGLQGGIERFHAENCALQAPPTGLTVLHIDGLRCGIVDDITLDTSNNNILIDSYSLVPATGTPIVRASGSSGSLIMNGHKGGVDLRDLSASHNLTVNIDGGQCIFDASCNINATVSLRGIGTKTDNTAGMNNLEEAAFINMSKILDLLDDLAIKKNTAFTLHFPMVLSDHVTPGTGLTVTGERVLDSGVFVSVAGTFTEIGSGMYRFNALAADSNGDMGTWKFSAAGADDAKVTFKTIV